jgi:hypothetical protein
VQFLLAGLAVFVIYGAVREPPHLDALQRIELTTDDVRRLELAWMARWQRPPTPEELRGLIEAELRLEVLYREALALGLDRGDTIVKRRLAQKMEFLAEDVAALREPSVNELKAWFETHRARFASLPRATFRHLYFSFDRRSDRAQGDARRALSSLADEPVAPLNGMSDPFMFQDYYADSTPEEVASVFGTRFAEALFQLKPRSWQGPIESGLGWHLVRVESLTPARIPAFEEVEPAVRSEWMADQRGEAKRKAFEAMRARYEVVVPPATARVATDAGARRIEGPP